MAAENTSSYLTMSELARRLDLPESTMRYYCKRFAKFLPYKGEGRRRRYAPETEKTLLFISNAMRRNKNATAVELMLQSGQYTPQLATQTGQLDVLPQPTGLQNNLPPAAPGALLSPESGQMLMNIMERQADALGQIAESLSALALNLGKNSSTLLPGFGQSSGHGQVLGPPASGLQGELSNTAGSSNEPGAAGADGTSAAELKEEINSLKQQMFTAEKLHQEDLEQLRKWLGHMGEAVAKLGGA